MKSVNMVILMGNVTRDPELKYTPSGKAVVSFGLAINRQYKDASGETKKEVDFLDIVAWGKLAEIICQYATKGTGMHVVGRLATRSWEAQDGSKRFKTEVIANDISLVGGKGSGSGSNSESAPIHDEPVSEEIDISDIPF